MRQTVLISAAQRKDWWPKFLLPFVKDNNNSFNWDLSNSKHCCYVLCIMLVQWGCISIGRIVVCSVLQSIFMRHRQAKLATPILSQLLRKANKLRALERQTFLLKDPSHQHFFLVWSHSLSVWNASLQIYLPYYITNQSWNATVTFFKDPAIFLVLKVKHKIKWNANALHLSLSLWKHPYSPSESKPKFYWLVHFLRVRKQHSLPDSCQTPPQAKRSCWLSAQPLLWCVWLMH